ncbi:MAG: carboxypeptidase-like regulatory domain-containing protein [Acidobacteriota bacterium]
MLEAQKVTIEGLVLSASGDPADNAVVTLFLTKKKEVVTAPGGKFSFPKVDLSNEPSKSVRIRASWQTHEAEITADLKNGPPDALTIRLPPGDPPFRVTYFVLEGQAIDFLLRHKMNARWEEKLGGQPFIVPNEVSKALSQLIKSYSEKSGYTFFEIENKGKNKSYDLTTEEYDVNFFTGSDQSSNLDISDPRDLISSMKDERQPWRVFYSKNAKKIGIDALVFRKFIDRNDLGLCEDSLFKSFYQHITKDYMPPDFGYVDIYFEVPVEGCGDDETSPIKYVMTKVVGRSMGLRIAVLENISKEPIGLGNFALKGNKQEGLRTRDQDKATLESQPAEQQALFPQRLLNPGEKIVIPLELPLSYEKGQFSGYEDETPITPKVRDGVVNELKEISEIKFPMFAPNSDFIVNARTVENILNRPSEDFRLNKEYLYGPSMSIESLEVDRVSYPFRQFDSARIIITGGTEGGSCPYVYTYSPDGESWRSEGVILYGINARRKKTTDEKELSRFDGRLLIKEKEPEDSFLDAVYIKAILVDGREAILLPKNKTLRFADNDYLRLTQGEEIRIDFDISHIPITSNYILKVVGYYIPHDKTILRRADSSAGRRLRPSTSKTAQ